MDKLILFMPKYKPVKTKKEFKIPLLEIEDYAKILDTDIFELLGLKNLSQAKKAEFGEKIGRIILDRVLIRVDSMLKGPEVAELKMLLERGSKEDLEKFFADKNIDIPKMMIQEAVVLKAQLTQFVMAKTGKSKLEEL